MDTIFFVLSKVVQFCIEPLNWVPIFILIALLFLSLRKMHLCKRFLVLALVDIVLVGWLPASEIFLQALEGAISKTALLKISEDDLGGIIILGGAIEGGEIAIDRGEISIYSSAERVTKAFELIRKYPNLPFVFSGYSGRIAPKGLSEADSFKQLIQEQGLSEAMAHYEDRSRNTYENALFMKPMIQEFGLRTDSGQLKPWLLITSASHMYRSTKVFQRLGLDVLPMPVDYQTAHHLRWGKFDLVDGAQNWNILAHEIVGLFAYWITGKI
ncbi:YdcF family protein [Polynucleobacter sp. MWH-Braz-FAM2G]|nr:YdcF family protein [Polynucleobacter sp. MWH-Braz-FAM2G]